MDSMFVNPYNGRCRFITATTLVRSGSRILSNRIFSLFHGSHSNSSFTATCLADTHVGRISFCCTFCHQHINIRRHEVQGFFFSCAPENKKCDITEHCWASPEVNRRLNIVVCLECNCRGKSVSSVPARRDMNLQEAEHAGTGSGRDGGVCGGFALRSVCQSSRSWKVAHTENSRELSRETEGVMHSRVCRRAHWQCVWPWWTLAEWNVKHQFSTCARTVM